MRFTDSPYESMMKETPRPGRRYAYQSDPRPFNEVLAECNERGYYAPASLPANHEPITEEAWREVEDGFCQGCEVMRCEGCRDSTCPGYITTVPCLYHELPF